MIQNVRRRKIGTLIGAEETPEAQQQQDEFYDENQRDLPHEGTAPWRSRLGDVTCLHASCQHHHLQRVDCDCIVFRVRRRDHSSDAKLASIVRREETQRAESRPNVNPRPRFPQGRIVTYRTTPRALILTIRAAAGFQLVHRSSGTMRPIRAWCMQSLARTYEDAQFLHHPYGGIYWAATGKTFGAE